MKKIYVFSIVLCISFLAQAQLYNNGGILSVASNAVLQVNHDFTNAANSAVVNNGAINIKGNLTNNATMSLPYNGNLTLEGASTQTINGTTAYFAKNVTFNNAAGITISKSLKADGEVKFQNGMITASNLNEPLVFTTNGTVSATNPPTNTSHVNGYVTKEGTGAFTYPVGDGIRYEKVATNLTANATGTRVKYFPNDAGAAPLANYLVAYNPFEYWDITPLSTATGTVTIHWDDYNNIGITDVVDLVVAHKLNGGWANELATASTGTIVEGSVTSQAISTWSPFALGSTSISSPLPIHLLSFTAKNIGNSNLLEWTTASETNNKGFEIETASSKGGELAWRKIGFVAAQGRAANYNFEDSFPFGEGRDGAVYYRLKQIDFDGRFEYSKIISIAQNGKKVLSIFPNPSNGLFIITGLEHTNNDNLTVINSIGQTLFIALQNDNQLDLSAYPSSVYYLRVASSGQVMKLVKE